MQKRLTFFCAFFLFLLLAGSIGAQVKDKGAAAKSIKEAGIDVIQRLKAPSTNRAQLLTESFESGVVPPDNWTAQTQSSYTWDSYMPEGGAYDGDYVASCQYDETPAQQEEWLISPVIDLSGVTTASLDFAWFGSYYWSVTPNDNCDLYAKVSIDGGTTWTEVWNEEDFGEFVNWAWNETSLDLSAYTGNANVKIAFHYSGYDGAQFVVDMISLTDAEACVIGDAANPSPLSGETNVAVSGSQLVWENDENATYVELYFGTDPDDLQMVAGGVGNLISSYDLPELEYFTNYYWGIISYRDEDCYSAGYLWSFQTEFDPAMNVLSFNDFESGSAPDNFIVVDGNGDSKTWGIYEGSAYSGSYCWSITYNGDLAMDDWFFIGPFTLTPENTQTLSFYHRVYSSSYPENLKGVVATATDGTGIVETLFDWQAMTHVAYENFTADFTVTSEGEYYIGFHGYSDADMFRILLDDILLSSTGGVVPPVGFTAHINVSDAGAKSSSMLTIGTDDEATDGIDPAMGEAEIPPAPPAGVFDARLMFPDNVTASMVDYRANGEEEYTYKMTFQPGDGGYPFTFSWDTAELTSGTFTLVDGVTGGSVVNVDMNQESSYTLTNTNLTSLQIVYVPIPVPVEMTAFSVKATGQAVQLNWATATETNNKGFEVERSSDNKAFTTIAFVDGKGTTAEKQNYSYTDRSVQGGTYYYRLTQVDYDGTKSVSEVKEVSFMPQEFNLGQNYPNPFNPSTKISFSLPVQSKVVMKLYNALGQEITELVNGQYGAGLHSVNFNASSLTSGVYFYTIEAVGADGAGFNQVKKMMLMK